MDSTTASGSTLDHSSQTRDPEASARWWLAVAHCADRDAIGRSIWLPPSEPVELGRDYGGFGAPVLDEKRVSRNHARLTRLRNGTLELEELGSRNGTYVNGGRVEGPALLARGDVVRLGSVLLLVGYDSDKPAPFAWASFVGACPSLRAQSESLLRSAESGRPLLITGATGTGKAHLASAVHTLSGRTGPLATVRCAAIPDRLIAHELFGYEQGAFPGAERASDGSIASAEHGTLVLRELRDASSRLQGALLAFLDDGTVPRLGSEEPLTVDTRVVATCRGTAHEPGIRSDLSARMASDMVHLPPLCERRIDIAVLADHFLNEVAGDDVRLHWRAAQFLLRAPWPGNARQLREVIARLLEASAGEKVLRPTPQLEALVRPEQQASLAASTDPALPEDDAIGMPPRRLSKQKLEQLLRDYSGNVTAISAHLGVGRNTVYRWLKVAALDLDEFR